MLSTAAFNRIKAAYELNIDMLGVPCVFSKAADVSPAPDEGTVTATFAAVDWVLSGTATNPSAPDWVIALLFHPAPVLQSDPIGTDFMRKNPPNAPATVHTYIADFAQVSTIADTVIAGWPNVKKDLSIVVGIKTVTDRDQLLENGYGVGQVLLSVKESDMDPQIPEKFDRFKLPGQIMTAAAVHPYYVNQKIIGYRIAVSGK
jgi:hypothetical protein